MPSNIEARQKYVGPLAFLHGTGYNPTMFLTQRILDLIVTTKNEAFAIALGAKENEIISLKSRIEVLSGEVKYERARADSLVDRLLVRDAKVSAVAPVAVAAAAERDKVAVERLKKTFEGLADVGDIPEQKEPRAFEIAGGLAVTR